MSVVAIRVTEKEIVIAADSQITSYATAEKREDAKLFQVNGITFGVVGYARDGVLFRLFCETRTPKSASVDDLLTFYADFDEWMRKRTNNESPDSWYHLVYDGKAFVIKGYYIAEITKYHAIGSGGDYALACLYLGHTPEKAVEAACDLNIYCSLPVNTFRVSRTKEVHDQASI